MVRAAIFPARGGSVRIPRKNIRDFHGKPMLQWPVEAAQASGLFDQIIISTDDVEIASLARWLDCEVHMRQPDDGSTGTQELAGRILDERPEVDEACVIYPCNPMLSGHDLVVAHWMLKPRVQWVISWLDNADAGCFYWGRAWSFLQRNPLTERQARYPADPRRFIDINTPEDWARAESMFNALHP